MNLISLLREGRHREAWLKNCGFLDFSLADFMWVQERLLKEQLGFLAESFLGKKLLGGYLPRSVAEFRRAVPLTTYEDYLPYLAEQREDVLPLKPSYWVCTSGKFGAYERKWAPYPQGMAQVHIKNFLAAIIFAVCAKKGDFTLKEGYKFLYAMAPPPYLTGMVPYGLEEEFPFEYLPPLRVAEQMNFEERNKEGFRLGLVKGIDLFFGVSSVLVRMGEKFAQGSAGSSELKVLSPAAVLRLANGLIRSKLGKRELLPKDVWNLKGIVCAGTDTAFYKERIEHYWGRKPLEVYGGTEIGIAATQTWDYEGMVLFPDANFWEFIPEEEFEKCRANPSYQPATALLPELEAGKRYEVVITNFKGGIFVRYRLGDLIRVLSLRNERLGINLPQIVYEDRAEGVIDLAGFTRTTGKTIWEALKRAKVRHGNWVARKAFAGSHPVVELYLEIELSESPRALEEEIHHALRAVDSDYHDLGEIMGYRPLRLVALPAGTFRRLRQGRGVNGGWDEELEQRVNPPEEFLARLLSAASGGGSNV